MSLSGETRALAASGRRRGSVAAEGVGGMHLVVEVDGRVHDSAKARARDAWRDAELARMYGVRVLRIDAGLVEQDAYAAAMLVRAALW